MRRAAGAGCELANPRVYVVTSELRDTDGPGSRVPGRYHEEMDELATSESVWGGSTRGLETYDTFAS